MSDRLDSTAAVSVDDEPLILVDEQDRETGYLDKLSCHLGDGRLHRAFSVFLFDHEGRVLLQQRSRHKLLWPLYWSNSCCSHPRRGETMRAAVSRRLREELGVEAELHYLYTFRYAARYHDVSTERECCSVFLGPTAQRPRPHPVIDIEEYPT